MASFCKKKTCLIFFPHACVKKIFVLMYKKQTHKNPLKTEMPRRNKNPTHWKSQPRQRRQGGDTEPPAATDPDSFVGTWKEMTNNFSDAFNQTTQDLSNSYTNSKNTLSNSASQAKDMLAATSDYVHSFWPSSSFLAGTNTPPPSTSTGGQPRKRRCRSRSRQKRKSCIQRKFATRSRKR